MIAQHTLTHAIQYLREAARAKCPDLTVMMSDSEALYVIGPNRPCAAYGLAKRTLRRCVSLNAAIADLEKQLEQP